MTLYLDTSSLVKLYVVEPGSDAVRTLVNAATLVVTSFDTALNRAARSLGRTLRRVR